MRPFEARLSQLKMKAAVGMPACRAAYSKGAAKGGRWCVKNSKSTASKLASAMRGTTSAASRAMTRTFVAPDFDLDCDVDVDDFDRFKACSTREAVPYSAAGLPAGCTFTPSGGRIAPDFDDDGDVDVRDFGVFQRCISGADRSPPPGCDS